MNTSQINTEFVRRLANSFVCVIVEDGFKTPYLVLKQDDGITFAFANSVYEGSEYFITESDLMSSKIEYFADENIHAVTLPDGSMIPFMLP